MSIASEITRLGNTADALEAAKTAISAAITAKGGTVGAGDGFADFAAAVAGIPSGESHYELESVTEYTHSEDWTNDTLGNALNFANTYCNNLDEEDHRLYICYISNNTAPNQNYRANYAVSQNATTYAQIFLNLRSGWTNPATSKLTSRSFHISTGAKIKVFVFKWGVS